MSSAPREETACTQKVHVLRGATHKEPKSLLAGCNERVYPMDSRNVGRGGWQIL